MARYGEEREHRLLSYCCMNESNSIFGQRGAEKQSGDGAVLWRSLPEPRELVMAHCRGFNCLAYVDDEGVWRDAFHDHPLSSVLGFRRAGQGTG
jgi:hypothetical protein